MSKFNTTATKSQMSLCGVYEIVHIPSGKLYVGSAAISFAKRWEGHISLLRREKHHCRHLQSAWSKYGESDFEFRIAEVTKPEHAVAVEQTFIDFRKQSKKNAVYNTCLIAGSPLGIKHSEEAKSKIREINRKRMADPAARAEHGEKIRKSCALRTPEQKAAINERARQRMSNPDYRAKISNKAKQRYADPEELAALMERSSSPIARAAQSERMRQRYSNQSERDAQSERKRQCYSDPSKREAVRQRMLSFWSDPAARSAAADRMRKRMAARTPEQIANQLAKQRETKARNKAKKIASQISQTK